MEYDLTYYEKMLKINTPTAELINRKRWEWVQECNPKTVLDYGAGCNFLSLFAPPNVVVDSYDIGTINGCRYPQTGLRRAAYDLIFINDVLEHIEWQYMPDLKIEDALKMATFASVSVPILPEGVYLHTWKHYKENEHLTTFTAQTLIDFFAERGYDCVKNGQPECPPRTDIGSFLFQRRKYRGKADR